MTYIFCILIFFFGTAIGSFLNVLIYRLPRDKKFVGGRSFCPNCNKKLVWWELIPLFSFLFLKGKCSQCKQRISWKYPLVEFVTGALFLLVFLKTLNYNFTSIYTIVSLTYYWLIVSILITIFFIDFEHYIIPDSLLIIGSLGSLIYLALKSFVFMGSLDLTSHSYLRSWINKLFFSYNNLQFHYLPLIDHIIFAIIGISFFLLIVLLTKGKGMGIGDVKLAGLMGLVLGSTVLLSFYLAFVSGALFGIFLVLLKKKKLTSKVPFGTFLTVATILCILL